MLNNWPQAFIVTCAKSPPARLHSARRELAALDPAIRSNVVMGAVAEDAEIDRLYDARRNRRCMKRGLTRTEIAIYASHRMAWQAVLDAGVPCALVLEDDFRIRDPALARRTLSAWPALMAEGRNLVKLFDFAKPRPHRAALERQVDGVPLVKWAAPTAGMVAYLITADGARKFLSRKRVFRQVDEDIKYFWELGLDIWSVPGSPIVDSSADLGGSLVEGERRANRTRTLGRSLWGNALTVDRKLRTKWHLSLESLSASGHAPSGDAGHRPEGP
jgi:GR25 family glycosyltransferase involved in LPS biosynthesis